MDTHHDDFQLLIQAESDGELDQILSPEEIAEFKAHTLHCAQCRQQKLLLQALSREIKSLPRPEVRPEFRQGLLKALAESHPKVSPGHRRFAPFGWVRVGLVGFALGMAAMILLTSLQPRSENPHAQVPLQLLASQQAALSAGRQLDIRAGAPAQIATWLNSRLPFTPVVKNLDSSGFRLMGARLEVIKNRVVETLVYQAAKNPTDLLSVAVWPEPEEPASLPKNLRQGSHSFVYWRQDGLDFWIYSAGPPSTLQSFSQAWRAAT